VYSLTPLALEELKQNNNLLQSGFWGAVKALSGQRVIGFMIEDNDAPLVVYLRKYGPGMTLAYIPHGPQLASNSTPETPPEEPGSYLQEITDGLQPQLPKSCVFIRYDLPWRVSDDYVGFLGLHLPFVKSQVNIQPPSTVLLDISLSEDDILQQMKTKTRYNIRLAGKKGVQVRQAAMKEIGNWYSMYEETARRDQIAIHSETYYKTPFELAENFTGLKPKMKLFMATIEGKDAAGIIVAAWGTRATYLYGASNNFKRNYMPAYALQWEAMKWAKSEGCKSYDLFGIPPTSDPDHPMHGLFRFKTGFGGEIVHRFGCWDYPLKPALYKISGTGEKLRNFYYKKLRKR